MKRPLLISIVAFVSLLHTPAGEAGKPKKKTADYFPLSVGNSWTYRTIGDEGGYTIKVLSEEVKPGEPTRYVVEMKSGVQVLTVFSKTAGWVLMHSERYPEHEGLEVKYDPPRQHLPDPPVAGRKWEWKGHDYTQVERHESSVVSGPEQVTVAAGKFRAIKIVSKISSSAGMTKTFWYANGVGLVKTMTEGGQINYGAELTEYSVKK